MHPSQQNLWHNVRATFQKIWGYDDFRSPQGEIIQCLLAKQDALVVMPTGGGKSICFQLPALLETGLTLVVSPLVALMENQVQDLQQRQLPAALLHSELSKDQRYRVMQAIARQQLRLLYLSPETLLSAPVWQQLSQPQIKINGLILDEAHCLVQWGDTFRPAYRRLGAVRPALLQTKPPGSKMAIAAFTATADPQAQQTIQQVLQLQNPQPFLNNPYRPHLRLSIQVAWTPRQRRQQLLQLIRARSPQTGLVYIRTRRDAEELATWLTQQGYPTLPYHAGLSPGQRRQIEADWLANKLPFVVCTSAFGMGVNHPSVRWVVHFQIPLLLSEYLQEVGRAGRDGQWAEALALVSEPTGWLDDTDRQRLQFFKAQMNKQRQTAQQLVQRLPKQGEISAIARQFKGGDVALSLLHSTGQLTWDDPFHYRIESTARSPVAAPMVGISEMQQYLTSKTCRWRFLLEAFGFAEAAKTALSQGNSCGHCDRCLRKSGLRIECEC
jgi:ATP-dependent DNA helicase RecQ